MPFFDFGVIGCNRRPVTGSADLEAALTDKECAGECSEADGRQADPAEADADGRENKADDGDDEQDRSA